MSKQEGAANSDQPMIRLQKFYVKDLSFENPNAPDSFLAQSSGSEQPRVEVKLNINNRKITGEDNYEVGISVSAKVTQGEDNKTLFVVELEHYGIFTLRNIPADHFEAILAVECPIMIYPYTRQIVSQVTVDGGFAPFLLEPVNFLAMHQNSKKKK